MWYYIILIQVRHRIWNIHVNIEFLFAKDSFVENLNPFTRFIVYISTKTPKTMAQRLYFLNEKQLWIKKSDAESVNILADTSVFKSSYESLDISDDIPTLERFLMTDVVQNKNINYFSVDRMSNFASNTKQCSRFGGTIGGKRIKVRLLLFLTYQIILSIL